MKIKKILSYLLCIAIVMTSLGTVFADGAAQGISTDETGTYLIYSADDLFAFADLAKATAEADGASRTKLNAKLAANININPNVTFAYDCASGLVTVKKGETSYKMGTGMKNTELGSFHPIYNGLCTVDEWDAKTEDEKTVLIAQMNEKVNALELRKWTSVGTKALPYFGTFDGNGYTIDGLYVNDKDVNYAGLFGVLGIDSTILCGEIKNLTIGENSLVVGYYTEQNGATGSIAARVQFDKITDCINRATVVGKGHESSTGASCGLVGGIAGFLTGEIKNCTNYGTIVSRESAGGIVGNIMGNQYDRGAVSYCTNHGSIYADTDYMFGRAGGIAINNGGTGNAYDYGGSISLCTNYGYVEGGAASGIVHRSASSAETEYCANHGEIAATSVASGITDNIGKGGFTMKGCYNAGKITALEYNGTNNPLRLFYPISSRIYTYITDGAPSSHTISLCYNDETVCPTNDGALFGEKISASKSYSVETEVFASGETAYNMGSSKNKWKQDLSVSATDGKVTDIYPKTVGTKYVSMQTRYCCHTAKTHKTYFFTNEAKDITADHIPGADGICEHCEKYALPPKFTTETLPELKAGEYKNIYIYTNEASNVTSFELVTSETDNTPYTLPDGLYYSAPGNNFNIYGTPVSAGTYNFAIKATNEIGSTVKGFTLVVKGADPIKITTLEKLNNATVGETYYSYRLELNLTYLKPTWSLEKGSVLPDGLLLDEKGANITGTPTVPGKYTFTIVADANGETVSKTFTLTVLEEGGCKHKGMTKIEEEPATCLKDGTAAYYHCDICGEDFTDANGTSILYDKITLRTAANHTDKNNDGKCDICKKHMPIFKKVMTDDGIVYGGTYIFVTKIGDEYYAMANPQNSDDGKGVGGKQYTDFMNLCKITAKPDGSFDFNTLEQSGAAMMKTEFAAADGNLDAAMRRFSLTTVLDNKRYSFADHQNAFFYLYPAEEAKYGYCITLNLKGETVGEAIIGSVEQKWWSKPETAENGVLRAYDMNENGENTKFMSFYGESSYKTSDTQINTYPIYLYRMTNVGETLSGISFTVNDANHNADSTTFPGFFGNYDSAVYSNASGIANAVSQTAMETYIAAAGTAQTSVTAEVYAQIAVTDYEGDEKEPLSVTYSVTPKINILDADGQTVSQIEISDDNLNGAEITVALYVGFEPQQIIHYKGDGTNEYFYQQWSEQARNGAKTFEFDNGFAIFTITEFSEIKILKNAEEEQETAEYKLQFDGKSITVTCAVDGTYALILKPDGEKSADIKVYNQKFAKGSNEFALPDGYELTVGGKILLWENLVSMRPLCDAFNIEK